MARFPYRQWLPLCSLVALLLAIPVSAQQGAGPDPNVWNKTVDQAITFLKSKQADDGTWGGAQAAPALTGIVTAALLKSGKVPANDPAIAKALAYIEGMHDLKDGHLAGKTKINLHNYVTSVNIMALRAADPEGQKYQAVVQKAAAYLKKLQWSEEQGKKPEDAIYGGAGYGGGSRPDLSNTQFFLEAMRAAKVPASDPVYRKAAIYVSRCQNLKGEHNDQPWAGKINDGSFIYGAGPAGETRGDPGKDGARPGYGSMTFAGLKSLLICGVPASDPRCQKALQWIGAHYSVDINPGMPAGAGAQGLYYYLADMGQCLETLGQPEVTTADDKKHDWRADITTALANRQQKDGSWSNSIDRWMEGNPELATSWALIALGHCKPQAK
jgi:squalene-hopene/tetraprenyl-beta-curcumene cyclase